jgi:phage tail sheath protein FI
MPSSEKIISPGVFTTEIDQSYLPAAIGDIGGAIVGPTVKGPAGVPVVVNSFSEFEQRFGDEFISGSDYFRYFTSLAAEQYLRHAPSLTVIRVLPGTFSHASTIVSGSGTSTGNTYASGTLVVNPPSSSAASATYENTDITIGGTDFTILKNIHNLSHTSTQVFIESGSTVKQTAINISNAIGSSSIHGLNISASATQTPDAVGVNAGWIVQITGSTAGTTSNLTASVNGTAATIGNALYFSQVGGTATTVTTALGTNRNKLPEGSSYAIQGGTDSATTNVSFKLHTMGDGTVMNSTSNDGTNHVLPSGSIHNLRWEVTNVNNKKGTFTLLVRRGNDSSKRKVSLESWSNVSLDTKANNYIGKVIGDQKFTLRDAGTTDPYLQLSGSFPNKSKYVRVEVISPTVDYIDENGDIRLNELSASLPSAASGSFAGGSDGTLAHPQKFYHNITSTNTQGIDPTTAGNGKTSYEDALNLLSNQDEYDFNLLWLPGISDADHNAIATKAIQICEDRGDCFTVLDPVLYNRTISQATTESETRDTSYAAHYWPWIQVPDNKLGGNIWVPPSVAIPGIYAFNDKVAHPWFAPAGLNRGGIDSAIMAERKLTHANRDTLYDSNVNPIATFPGQGVTVYGQKTLQKKASALDRINVRRLLIKLKKFIASSSRFLVFEQNNSATRRRFLNIVNPFLESVQSNSGLTAFRVVMDETNNTPDVVDRNVLYGQIFVQPTRTAEFIVLDFTVQPSGATFPE